MDIKLIYTYKYIVYKMRFNVVYNGYIILYTSDIFLVC